MKITKFITLVVSIFSTSLFAQTDKNIGVGLHIGDPTGITFKKYLDNEKSVEFIIGRTALWGHGYYASRFNNYDDFDGYNFVDYDLKSAISLQGHYYLFQKDFSIGELDGFAWYAGVGGQFRVLTVKYKYQYQTTTYCWGPSPNQCLYDTKYEEETKIDIDFGIDFAGGMEYTFSEVPITVFVDANLFLEIVNNPFFPRAQSGVGGRYNF
ncbi:MAG: hypothetical protein COA57_05480 [Flavobacteriales bacterium]|nr:MAG: hypothetical protein COA57_05480 [Flavobacteriales bacterium]